MGSERHARVKRIFLEASDKPLADREEFLAGACGGDEELQREVESLLLRVGDVSDSVSELETGDALFPAFGGVRDIPTIAGYQIVQRIGEGGMGEVYEAEQQQPVRRRVAVKVLKAGLETREVLARFESERQALALMNHPNIARIFEAGVTEREMPYFAMELVHGEPITKYCDRHRLATPDRLALFVEVCAGVQHAHQKGIIHRDLKPSNVLVTFEDGRPVPKIIDFGVARATAQPLTERTLFTEIGQWIGTPEYMSPEQAEMTGLDIDTRTDVYSLGVLLYELLVGERPFDSTALRQAGFDEMRRRIREDEPTRPSTKVSGLGEDSDMAARYGQADVATLVRQLRGDLDWITMKALAKDRTRRYASPSELAGDVQRHLSDEPVLASPPGAAYQLAKFARRHRTGVVAGALVVLALVLGAAATTVGLVRAKRDARTARQVSDFLVGMFNDLQPGGSRRSASTPQEILGAGVDRIEVELAGQPRVQAQLATAIGSTYRGLGMEERAKQQLEKAATTWRDRLNTRGQEYALTISILGDLLTETGGFERARRLHEEALQIRRTQLGPEHAEVAWSLRSLAILHWRQAEYEAARGLYAQALEINRKAGGANSLDEATTLRLQALLELHAGDYEVAKPLFRQALAIYEETVGQNHTEVGWCLVDFSLALNRTGDFDAALTASSRAMEIFESLYGPDHPSLASPLSINAVVRLDIGDVAGARSRLERALAILESAPERERTSLGWVLFEIGRTAQATGALEEAQSFFERSLVLQEQIHGTRHPYVAFPLSSLGELLSRGGDHGAALPLLERALAIREETLGPDHLEVVWTLRPWAALLRRTGDFRGARHLLDRALSITENAFGGNDLETTRTLADFGFLEYEMGNLEQAQEFYRRSFEIRQALFGPEHPALAGALYNLACLAALVHEPEEALSLITRAVELGFANRTIFADPDLNSLRGDPKFETLVERVRSRLTDA